MVYPANTAPSAMGMRESYKAPTWTHPQKPLRFGNWIGGALPRSTTGFPYRDRHGRTSARPARRRPGARQPSSAAPAGRHRRPGRRHRQRLLESPRPPEFVSTPSPTAAAGPDASPTASPPPQPMTSPATHGERRFGVFVLCRDAWGARPARAGGTPHTLTRMTIHHTAAVLGDNRNAPARLRQHQQYHQDHRGGSTSPITSASTATGTSSSCGHRPRGRHRDELRPDRPLPRRLRRRLRRRGGDGGPTPWSRPRVRLGRPAIWHRDRHAGGHRDVSPDTACPGANLDAHVSSGDLKRRIDDLLAAGTVDLQPVCGPDAARIVADIEAGH